MRLQRPIVSPSLRAPAILVVAGLLAVSTGLRADPPTPASLNLRAAGEARALAERVITQYLDEAGRGSVEGVHRGFEAIRAWVPTRTGGDALTVEQVVQAFANGGGLTGEAGPYADALSRAVVEGARSAAGSGGGGGPLEGSLANLERAITDRVRTAASGFAGAHAGLIQSARWEVIFEALDTGFVPTTTLGPVATAFLRNLGVPVPAAAAERMAAGLLAAQTGIVAADSVLAGGGGSSGPRPGDDPFNTITQLELGRPGARPTALGALPPTAFLRIPMGTKDTPPTGPPPPPPKIDPFLTRMVRDRPATERVQVMITLREELRLPRFPEFQSGGSDLVAMADVPPDSTAGPSAAERSRASDGLVTQIRAQRQPTYDRLRNAWTASFGVEVKKTFWLIPGMLVEMPLGRVAALSEQADVVFVEPRFGNDVPPQDANANNDIEDGRGRISSEPYFTVLNTVGSRGEFLALLDSGVRLTHQLFGPRILVREDCTGADLACDGAPDPSLDHWNHGTSAAGILIGNDSLGAAFRGVTPFFMDSFKIYDSVTLDRAGTVTAFERAVNLANKVIVAEIQSSQGEVGSIVTAAEHAFDRGAVVISANGNFGPAASTSRSPGSAHKVIAIGSVDVQTLAMLPSQGRGPTADGRIKPDLQAPTNTETASNVSDSALKVFGGTSGATPYAAAAAALARKWMRGTNSIDPGQVYAFLIMAGQQPYPFNNDSGAGLLIMPTTGFIRWGKVSVAAGGTVEIPITVAAGQQQVDAAIWWPEGEAEAHDDIDLWLVDPAGTMRQRSWSVPSVFEKVRLRGTPLATGNWKIQIRGYTVASGPQDVYWATHVKP